MLKFINRSYYIYYLFYYTDQPPPALVAFALLKHNCDLLLKEVIETLYTDKHGRDSEIISTIKTCLEAKNEDRTYKYLIDKCLVMADVIKQ